MHGRHLRGFLPHGTSDVSMTSLCLGRSLSRSNSFRGRLLFYSSWLRRVGCRSSLHFSVCRPSSSSTRQKRAFFLHISARWIDTHLGSPIIVSCLPTTTNSGMCSVVALEVYLRRRVDPHVAHDYIFCGFSPPHDPISMALFSDHLRWVMRCSGIVAPPGSTCATSVSDAFARGESVMSVLHAGDWSRAGTFYRHYLRPSAAFTA